MEERELAKNIMEVHGKTLVNDIGTKSASGYQLGERYAEKLFEEDIYDLGQIDERAMSLMHLVESAGYNDKGSFVFSISNHIMDY